MFFLFSETRVWFCAIVLRHAMYRGDTKSELKSNKVILRTNTISASSGAINAVECLAATRQQSWKIVLKDHSTFSRSSYVCEVEIFELRILVCCNRKSRKCRDMAKTAIVLMNTKKITCILDDVKVTERLAAAWQYRWKIILKTFWTLWSTTYFCDVDIFES